MDTTADLRTRVLDALRDIAPEADVGALSPAQPLREQVDLDSMDWLNVLEALAARLAIEIPETDYPRLATVAMLADYVAERRGEGGAALPGAPRLLGGPRLPDGPLPADGRPPLDGEMPAPAVHTVGGAAVTVRPLCRDDIAMEAAFIRNLSAEARYTRFMASMSGVSKEKLAALTDVDQVRNVALAALIRSDGGSDGRFDGGQAIVGVARYSLDDRGSQCEFAVTVGDAWQGSGLAGILMRALIDIARRRGVRTMEGLVLAVNAPMLKLARQLGFEVERDEGGAETVRVVLDLQAAGRR